MNLSVPVPLEIGLIGFQLTFQTATGPLHTKTDALSFPAMAVITP